MTDNAFTATQKWLHDHQRRLDADPAYRARLEHQAAAYDAEQTRIEHADRCAARAAVLHGLPLRADVERSLVRGAQLEVTSTLTTVQAWWHRADVRPILVLAGNVGAGKTVAAAWALAQTAQTNTSAMWMSATELATLWAQQFDRDDLRRQNLVRRCGLLVVDDVGREFDARRMAATLLELIDARQHSARRYRTIITTNLSRAAFGARYADPRIASRIAPTAETVAWCSTTESDRRAR